MSPAQHDFEPRSEPDVPRFWSILIAQSSFWKILCYSRPLVRVITVTVRGRDVRCGRKALVRPRSRIMDLSPLTNGGIKDVTPVQYVQG